MRLDDEQRYRTVILAEHTSVEALAAATFDHSADVPFSTTNEIEVQALAASGPDFASQREKSDYGLQMIWVDGETQWCSYNGYAEPYIDASLEPLRCNGMFVEANSYLGNPEVQRVSIGLFASDVMDAFR